MSNLQNLFALLGRILLALIFLQSGYGKIMNFDPTAAGMVKAGLPMVSVLLPITIFVELAGAVSLILGFKARWGAFGLLVFTLLAAYFFHNFWTMADPQARMQMIHFMKNMAISGGMLMVMAFGAGRYSIDKR